MSNQIIKVVRQIMPFELGWTFNYLYFEKDCEVEVVSLPIVGQALVDWLYPNDKTPEPHIEAVCLEEGAFRTESLLFACDSSNVEMMGVRPPCHKITRDEIEHHTQSYKRLREWKDKLTVAR